MTATPWGEVPNMRVTRFKLDKREEAAAVVYEQGGAEITKGVLCRTQRDDLKNYI